MKLKYLLIIILLLLKIGISIAQVNLSGTWIESKNYKNPQILEISNSQIHFLYSPSDYIVNYNITNDTIILNNNQFMVYDSDNHSLKWTKMTFKPMHQDHYINYILNKLKININLPDIDFPVNYLSNEINNFISLFEENDETFFSFNGQIFPIDSFDISLSKSPFTTIENIFLFVDKDVKMIRVFQLEGVIKNQDFTKVVYVAKPQPEDNSSELKGLQRYILHFDYSGFQINNRIKTSSVRDQEQIPPPPSPYQFAKFDLLQKDSYSVYELVKDTLYLNGKVYDISNVYNNLHDNVNKNFNHIQVIYISPESTYKVYLKLLNTIYQFYNDIWEKYSKKLYGQKYSLLTAKEQQIIRKKIPKAVLMVSEKELFHYIYKKNR